MEATEEAVEPSPSDILPPVAGRHRPHLALLLALGVAGLIVLGVAAGVAWSRHSTHRSAATSAPTVPLLTVDPPAGAQGIRPDAKVNVQANRGRFTSVRLVDGGGNEVAGTLAPLGRSWTSTGPLFLARGYKLTAEITGVGKRPVVRTSEFTTIRPAGLLGPNITPG